MRQVNDRQFAAVSALPGPDRYGHMVEHVADAGELWSLRGPDGWALLADDGGRELVLVWPHPRYAAACAVGPLAGTEPASIPLDRWLDAWTPGIATDGRLVAAFPTPAGAGVVVPPDRLRDDLAAALEGVE